MNEWNKEKLLTYIASGVEENKHLEYKGAQALNTSDHYKKEISKDISAFANSDGGVIIYGIKEFDIAEKRHLPQEIEPINRTIFSKEWLENIISGNISPIIENIAINSITIDEGSNTCVYVIEIEKSTTAHQANDNRYYKRREFKSTPMEDWEVKDVINRSSKPIIEVTLIAQKNKFVDRILTKADGQIKLMMRNIGNSSVSHIQCYFIFEEKYSDLIMDSTIDIGDGYIQTSISNRKEFKINIGGIDSVISTELFPLLPGGIMTEVAFLPIKSDLLNKDLKIDCIINTEFGIIEKEFEMNSIKK